MSKTQTVEEFLRNGGAVKRVAPAGSEELRRTLDRQRPDRHRAPQWLVRKGKLHGKSRKVK